MTQKQYELTYGKAYFRLKDYLSPGRKHLLEDLRPNMQLALESGLYVYLWGVDGRQIVVGHYDLLEDGEPPWHCIDDDRWVNTLDEVEL